MKAVFIFSVLLLALIAAVVYQVKQSQAIQNNKYSHAWFVALKGSQRDISIANGVNIVWQAKADFAFISADGLDPYWNTFMLLGSDQPSNQPLLLASNTGDAHVIELEPFETPLMSLAAISIYSKLRQWGVLGKRLELPTNEVDLSIIRAGTGPTQASVDALFDRPVTQKPQMVNFLKYFDKAKYQTDSPEAQRGLSGHAAYQLYGDVASKTVYGIGGEYVLGGRVKSVLRQADSGITVGDWDEIAIMQYPNQTAILTMDQVQEYRDAFKHRNAGLERTVIVAALAD